MLARLAVEQSVQGRGLGEVMLFDAVRRCASLADSLCVHAVEVQAIDDRARAFYQKLGFDELIDENPAPDAGDRDDSGRNPAEA